MPFSDIPNFIFIFLCIEGKQSYEPSWNEKSSIWYIFQFVPNQVSVICGITIKLPIICGIVSGPVTSALLKHFEIDCSGDYTAYDGQLYDDQIAETEYFSFQDGS